MTSKSGRTSAVSNLFAVAFVGAMTSGLIGCAGTKPATEGTQATAQSAGEAASQPASYFEIDAEGTLMRPSASDYRTWVVVGEPLTPNDMNNGSAPFPEFHSVYIDPESYEQYRQTGKFRDGTILIKELISVGSTVAVSGNGYFMGEFIGLEATIKSSALFPNEPGNWAYFSFTDETGGPVKPTAQAFDTASCNTCHEDNAQDDWVFTQYYPVLRGAKDEEVAPPGAAYFDISSDGTLKRPKGYRRWVYVGSPNTPNVLNGGKAPFPEIHTVYIDPDSYEHYAKTGEFPEGTILMKELVSVGSTQAASGNGYFMGDFIGLEATIKSAQHFPNEPGNWAYFSFTEEGGGPVKDTAKAFDAASCNGCHETTAKDDWVFTQYYPVLRAAMDPEGTATSGGAAGPSTTWQPTAPTPAKSPSRAPIEGDALFSFLQDGVYKKFPHQESATHPGRGPHTELGLPVKVYYNKILANSFKAGEEMHPAGSTAVKEMHDADGNLQGWAVMTKTGEDSDQGRGWFWYEVTSTTDSSALQAIGNGIPGCVSCHSRGSQDLTVSGYPLK
jgi:cytochrome c553